MKQGKLLVFAAICITAVLICGCGKDDEGKGTPAPSQSPAQGSGGSATQTPVQPQAPAQAPAGSSAATGGAPSPTDLSAMAAQNREALTKMNQGKEITAVEGATLKGLLPENLAGMKRTSASGEKQQMMGIDMSKAEGEYEGQNDASLRLTITDVGNMSGSMRMGMVGWTMAQYSRETDSGYEKTGTYNGYKGMEEYDTNNKSGTIRIFVAERFIIELDGNNTTMDAMKQALGQLDLKKMASLASGS